jgi:hypothetical protein
VDAIAMVVKAFEGVTLFYKQISTQSPFYEQGAKTQYPLGL